MGFPITVNGRTWNLSDFQTGKHHENLGQFLYDCTQDFANRFFGTSTTTLTIGTGSKTLTTQAAKAWRVGMRVQLVPRNPSDGTALRLLGVMNGVVTAYNTGTGSMTVNVETHYGNSAVSNWFVMPGNGAQVGSTPLSNAYGGSGVTTQAAAREFAGMVSKATSMNTLFEDFCGYFPALTATNDQNQNWLQVICNGGGRVLSGGNAVADPGLTNKKLGILDGQHPGIAVLEVTGVGDYAHINLSSAPIGCLNAGSELVTQFYLPTANDGVNEIQMEIGFSIPENYPGGGSYPGFAMHWPGFGGGPTADVDVTVPGSEIEIAGYVPILAGKWYTLHLGNNGGEYWGELYTLDSSGNMNVVTDWVSGFLPTANSSNSYWPFVRLTKTKGGKPRTLLVDFIHWKRNASRT